ncbi:TPA: glycoside hydrolase family 38 C-terminal domain-containing protein [Enterococcus faecium]
MKEIYTVAHTHWDFEWYFTRQEAKVQFIFHMDEVLEALETNQLDFYTLDGQMSILDDYLQLFPEKEVQIKKFVEAQRLFVGPWFTQIDEMTTSGESIVRNLRIGIHEAEALGHAMKIGYLPDSFGQNQDMPKIYQGFEIKHALFWRGMPKEAQARYFYWSSNDGSKVLTANIKNGYYSGVDLIEQADPTNLIKRISSDTTSKVHILPVGGDQRAVDFNFKEKIAEGNAKLEDAVLIESNYPTFFKSLESQVSENTVFSGEFIEPTDSKIHRGIYSSRYDLKQLYDQLERILTYQLEPLSVLARNQGITVKQGLIKNIWKVVARGQAHDSAGGCNSDKTNKDIYMRGINGLQEAQSCVDYLLRKLSSSIHPNKKNEVFIWNPLPFEWKMIKIIEISTKAANFSLVDSEGEKISFEILEQTKENAALLRRNPEERLDDSFYISKIALKCNLPAMSWLCYEIIEETEESPNLKEAEKIENDWYIIQYKDGRLDLYSKENKQWYHNFLTIEDGGDEGDTYDYSPAFSDWILHLGFNELVEKKTEQGNLVSRIFLKGRWKVPYDLKAREEKILNGWMDYELCLSLNRQNNRIDLQIEIDNQALDHRVRILLDTKTKALYSTSDTPFGIIDRPINDLHLNDWRESGYKEEPTGMRPFIHLANLHDAEQSWTFLTRGTKDFQVLQKKVQLLAITIFRGVGYLGRPDTLRRPGDASGLQTKKVPTPESQLMGKLIFEGSIIVETEFDAQKKQEDYLMTTQNGLYYQTQDINRFTTPIQYFPINLMNLQQNEEELIRAEKLSVVFSSMQTTIDQTGIELRLYNPTNDVQSEPGSLIFGTKAQVKRLNLEGKAKETIASDIKKHSMSPFRPGEIRTYGIYFEQKERKSNV